MFHLRERLTNILLAGIDSVVSKFVFESLPLRTDTLIEYLATACVALGLYRFGLRVILRRLRELGINVKKVVILGQSPLVEQILNKIVSHSFYGYKVIGFFGSFLSNPVSVPRLGKLDEFVGNLGHLNPDEVIIALPPEFASKLPVFINACESHGARARVISSLASGLLTPGQMNDLDGIKLVNAHSYPTERLDYLIVKRIFDVILSLLLLVLLIPLLLLIALAVKVSSEGPVFFKQQRVGLNGKRFWMWKFRTMTYVESAVSDTEWTPLEVNRFTRFGKLLRRTNLDELPQLWNVLRGEMSLVGPRPERPFYIEIFKKQVPQYMLRHFVKSGITGWAQINGWRGNTSIQKRIEHDLYYMKNWGFWLDIKILFYTLYRGMYQREAC